MLLDRYNTYVHEGFNTAHIRGLNIGIETGAPLAGCRVRLVAGSRFNFPVTFEEISFNSDTPVVVGGFNREFSISVLDIDDRGGLLAVVVAVSIPFLLFVPIVFHVLYIRMC